MAGQLNSQIGAIENLLTITEVVFLLTKTGDGTTQIVVDNCIIYAKFLQV